MRTHLVHFEKRRARMFSRRSIVSSECSVALSNVSRYTCMRNKELGIWRGSMPVQQFERYRNAGTCTCTAESSSCRHNMPSEYVPIHSSLFRTSALMLPARRRKGQCCTKNVSVRRAYGGRDTRDAKGGDENYDKCPGVSRGGGGPIGSRE